MEIWGTKTLSRSGPTKDALIESVRGILLGPGEPNANGRVYSPNIIRREILRLQGRLKKTPLLEMTERIFNDDYALEVDYPDLATDISRQLRVAHPDAPRFTITKLKIEDDKALIDIAFDTPIRPSTLGHTPISISSIGSIGDDGTVVIDES